MDQSEAQKFRLDELVLEVNKYYDRSLIPLDDWDAFLDRLCQGREYQKQAIKKAVLYLLDRQYPDLNAFAKHNFEKNMELQRKYGHTFHKFSQYLQLGTRKYATIDLATGTGKSYVLYGIAQIMLGLGAVERVLLLCPSNTIEYGLTEKFKQLSCDSVLGSTIPSSAVIGRPRIIDANSTVRSGDICIENIHSVYAATGSSIDDSFMGTGSNTLVLNDEAHHIFNKHDGNTTETKNYKKWKEFLLNDEYGFHYMIGVTGTAYIDNDYFVDVIYRYSLKQAIDDGIVKNIHYVLNDEEIDIHEKYLKIYQNHMEYKRLYDQIKPLTIFVTKDITGAKSLARQLMEQLMSIENITMEEAEAKVLVVTSASEHKKNVIELRDVDSKDNPREWIVSVSMLTEGWDVKNVFQIVPWVDRAFNSKLLIAQVLGRGLRLPLEYQVPQPKVTVFNHAAWSRNIRGLVYEVLEIESRLYSHPLVDSDRSRYHFSFYNINYDKLLVSKEHGHKEHFDYSRMEKDGIKLEAQALKFKRTVEYTDVLTDEAFGVDYQIEEDAYTVDEIVDKLYDEFNIREWEGITLQLGDDFYTKNNLPPRERIRDLIIRSMRKVGIEGELLSYRNRNFVLRSFNTMLRQNGKSADYVSVLNDLFQVDTRDMALEGVNIASLKKDSTIFYTYRYDEEVELNSRELFKRIVKDPVFQRSALVEVNPHDFKTPLSFVVTSSAPERSFVQQLIQYDHASLLSAWIKSRDKGFYSIAYTWRKNSHQKVNATFNPDFFLIQVIDGMTYIHVVEIKEDHDDSMENKAKWKYACEHFEALNSRLMKQNISQRYTFHFLSPSSYHVFFDYLKNNKLDVFRSELEILLEDK